jgi:hypothetical protein
MTNYDMYEYTLAILRKDKKGAVNIEEFESLLKFRSLWLFKSLLPKDGVNKSFVTALSPFLVKHDMALTTGSGLYSSFDIAPAHIISTYFGASTNVPVDIVTIDEMQERVANAVTAPSTAYPVCVLDSAGITVYGSSATPLWVDYYKYPTSPYMDYYITSALNYVYIAYTAPASHTTIPALTTLRSGVYNAAQDAAYHSLTAELEWKDNEKITIIEMILQDLGVALSDQNIVQTAILERNNTLVK